MSKYTKTLSPPEGEPWLETVDGLKYWLYDPGPTIGIQRSVFTEDPSVYMHVYGGGGRDSYSSYLFCYKGTRIGFTDYEILNGWSMPPPPKSASDREEGRRNGTYILRIRTVGMPVEDPSFKERLINAFGCAEMVARTLRKPSGLAHGANFALL